MSKSNLAPFHITDVIESEHLQKLQDTFAAISAISVVIVDPCGNRVTTPSNWDHFCGIFSELETTRHACTDSIAEMLADAKTKKNTVIHTCPNTGLATAATPIFLDDVFLGCWVFGQLKWDREAPMGQDKIEMAASHLGATEEEVTKILEELLPRSKQSFNRTHVFLESLNETLVTLGHYNIENCRQAQQLGRWLIMTPTPTCQTVSG